jgi:hypothetical protein
MAIRPTMLLSPKTSTKTDPQMTTGIALRNVIAPRTSSLVIGFGLIFLAIKRAKINEKSPDIIVETKAKATVSIIALKWNEKFAKLGGKKL